MLALTPVRDRTGVAGRPNCQSAPFSERFVSGVIEPDPRRRGTRAAGRLAESASVGAGESRCPYCSHALAPGQPTCPGCGRQLGMTSAAGTASRRNDEAWSSVLAAKDAEIAADTLKYRRRVDTGLLLFIIAFAMLWVPYLSYLGDLLAFIGVILLGLGRHAFDEMFRRWVVRGGVLVVLGIAVAFVAGVLYASEVTGAALTPGETIPAFIASLQPDLETFIVGDLVAVIFVSFGFACLPYGKADVFSRRLLWSGAVLAVVVSSVVVAVLWPQILPTLNNATAGGTINLGALSGLQTESLELGLLQIVPDLIFLYAYYRTRSQLFPTQVYSTLTGSRPNPPQSG